MKNTNAETIRVERHEQMDLKEMVTEAKMKVQTEQLEASSSEDEVRSLELELREAQVAHERREEAERQGKETNEKIAELTG